MRTMAVMLSVAILCVPNGWAKDQPVLGAATPDELVSRLEAAAESEDPMGMVALMTPRGRAEMSVGLTVAGAMMVAMQGFGMGMAEEISEAFEGTEDGSDPEAAAAAAKAQAEAAVERAAAAAEIEASTKRFEAILQRYGLPNMMDESAEPAGGPEEAMKAFENIDHIGYLTDMFAFMKDAFPGGEEESSSDFKGPIGKPVIDGDSGTISIGEESFDLVRIDGRWYVEPPSSMGGGPTE